MTPQGIQGWLRTVGSQVKNVQDFVCCLPQEYRSNFMVGHSSVAGQNGTPASPRVIMMNKVDNLEGRPMRMLLSFNGGESHMAGGKSIEIAYINPRNKEAEYFDLEFDEIRGKHLSNKNPESCMNCHGDVGKTPPGGAKMIFDVFGDWHRFVGGVTFPCNKDEDELKRIVEDQAVESVLSNPQYGCLDKSQLQKDSQGNYFRLLKPLADLDNAINEITDGPAKNQRTKWARASSVVKKYRAFFEGAGRCEGKTTDWMSADVYRRNFASLELDPRLKKDGDLEKIFRDVLADEDRKVSEYRKEQRALIKNKNQGKPIMAINRSSRACLETRKEDKYFKEYEESLFVRARAEKSKAHAQRDPLLLLELDNYLRGPRLQSRSLPVAAVRFALEGEGVGTYLLQKSFVPGELIHGGLPYDESAQTVPGKELAKISYYTSRGEINKSEKIQRLCAELKGISRAELGGAAGDSRSGSGSR